LRKAKAPAAPKRSARGAERELAAPVLSGIETELVAEPERERVGEETVPLWEAVTEPVPVAEA
jgi:hypothetical protein